MEIEWWYVQEVKDDDDGGDDEDGCEDGVSNDRSDS